MLHVTCNTYCLIPLLANSVSFTFTGKFLYLHRAYSNNVTYTSKLHYLQIRTSGKKMWLYHQRPIRANSKTADLLPTSITCIITLLTNSHIPTGSHLTTTHRGIGLVGSASAVGVYAVTAGSRNFHKKLARLICFLARVFSSEFLRPNRSQLYSAKVCRTCMNLHQHWTQ